MIKVNNNRVMPIPEARKNQGEQHQPHQPQKQNHQENKVAIGQNGGSLFEPSTLQPAPPIGKNLYIEARWGSENVKLNSPVKIFAQLNNAFNGIVTINIFHSHNGQNTQMASLYPEMKNGYVDVIWQTPNAKETRNKGYYFFMIFGGMANSISKNQLILS